MPTEIHGFCDEQFLPFKDAFRANFDAGLELGASLAVTHRGKMVVDLWGGFADRKQTRPWQQDTVVCVFSTTKIMAAFALLILVDRKCIELDTPVANYWPEFAQGGKGSVTVRDILTYRAGVPGFVPALPFEALHDWSSAVTNIEAQTHWFDGRRAVCYHPQTYGFLIGELIRRVDGRPFAKFFHDEIAKRVGADFQVGLSSKTDIERVAGLRWPTTTLDFAADSLQGRVWYSVGQPEPSGYYTWEHLSADLPASNGYGNGRSIARICSIMAMRGKLEGQVYLSEKVVEQAAQEQVYAEDPFMGMIRLGLGFGLHSREFPAPTATSFHWGGFGGSWGVMDPTTGISLGYAPNNLIVDFTEDKYCLGTRLNRFAIALEKLSLTL